MQIIIRADATPKMGTGHVMRSLALARWALQQGADVHFIGHIQVPWLQDLMRKMEIFTLLHGDVPAHESPQDLLDSLGERSKESWVVLDGYHFDLDCQQAIRNAGYKLLLIDDYAHLPEYSCDILLNQNIGAKQLTYTGDIGQKLLEPKYALLRQEFSSARQKAEMKQCPEKAKNIILTLGGGNFSEHIARIAPILALPEIADKTLQIIAGAMPQEHIYELLHNCPAQIKILGRIDDMPALLLDTDICITAGGSTCWELCCLGVPFLTISIAENQESVIHNLEHSGIAPLFNKTSFKKLLPFAERFKASQREMELVDGFGCSRVLKVMGAESNFLLRPVQPEDCLDIFCLANDPSVRANSLSSASIPLEEHKNWYAARLQKTDPFFIVFLDGKSVGYVRYDHINEDKYEVSIAISASYQRKGLGAKLLQKSASLAFENVNASIIATVKKINIASQKIFIKAGYIFLEEKEQNGQDVLLFILSQKAFIL